MARGPLFVEFGLGLVQRGGRFFQNCSRQWDEKRFSVIFDLVVSCHSVENNRKYLEMFTVLLRYPFFGRVKTLNTF